MNDAVFFTPKTKRSLLAEHGDNAVFTFTLSDDELSLRAKAIRAKKAKKVNASELLNWWPVVLGVVLACFGIELQDALGDLGVWATRIVLPLAAMVSQAHLGASMSLPQTLPQIALEIQFPLEGMMVRHNLKQGYSVKAVLLQVLMLHFVLTLVIWLIALQGPR